LWPDASRLIAYLQERQKTEAKKNGRRKTAGKSGRIGQEARLNDAAESAVTQCPADDLMQFHDTRG
jgi:hypothetical protein